MLLVKSSDSVRIIRVPKVDSILLCILGDFHDPAIVAHSRVYRTYSAIRQYFWWPGMRLHTCTLERVKYACGIKVVLVDEMGFCSLSHCDNIAGNTLRWIS